MPSGAATMQSSRMSLRAGLLEQRDRRDRAAARGEHRIDDERRAVREIARQLRVVPRRDRRVLVALQADVADARVRQQLEHRLDHAQAGAQHRHDDDVGVERLAVAPARAASRRAPASSAASRVASIASSRLSRCASRRKWLARVVRSRSAEQGILRDRMLHQMDGHGRTIHAVSRWNLPRDRIVRCDPRASVGIAARASSAVVGAARRVHRVGQARTPHQPARHGRHRRHDGRATAA